MATSTNPDWDPILMACQKGQLEIVQELLNNHTNNNGDERYVGIVHHANAIGQTALHIATWWANVDIMKVLLEHGALISAQNTMTGATPLHCAIQSSQAALRKSKRLAGIELLLLQYKANPNQKDLLGRIPIDYLDEDDIDRKDILKLFVMASKHKIYDYIEKKCDLHGVLDECESNNNNNKNNKLPIYQDKTPLVYLIQQWCSEEEGEEENNNNNDDNNSFYSKAFEAIVAWEDNYEDVQKSKTAALDLLLETILNLWRQQLQKQQSQSQQQQTATDDNDDSSKTTTTSTTKLHALQHAAYQLKSTIPSQETLELVWLTIARRNYVTLAQWLVDNDVATLTDTTTSTTSIIQNRQGMTPLQFAARSGHLEMVELLLKEKNNKDNDDDDDNNNTNDHNNNRVLSWVNIHHKDQRGQTALDAARVNGHEDIVKILSSAS